jgi:uncharacterized protein YbjQ (UPF0145 family)/predicted RNA-binding Zn-ribbon protein involved in translation (DUF1610 family)
MFEVLGLIYGSTKMANCSSCGVKVGFLERTDGKCPECFHEAKMANCSSCGVKVGFLEKIDGKCPECFVTTTPNRVSAGMDDRSIEQAANAKRELDLKIKAIMLTTETAPNLNITKRIEIVTAECAFGMNIFKDLFAGVRDIVGGRSKAVQKTMRDSRKTALYELKKEAYEVGANAVVGVDLDYVELSNAGSMVMLVASGTAVVIGETDDASQA